MNAPADDDAGRVWSEVGPWAMVPVWVLRKALTPAELATYVSLRSFADRQGDAYPTARRIAERANLAVGTARNAVQSLRRKGLLATEERYRADGSLAGLDYRMLDIDPDPLAPTEPKRAPKTPAPTDVDPSTDGPDEAGGTPTSAGGPAPTDAEGCTNSGTQEEHTREHTRGDHTKDQPPPPRDDAQPVDNSSSREEEEPEPDQTPTPDPGPDPLADMLDGLLAPIPASRRPYPVQRATLLLALATKTAAGWRPADLAEALGGPFDTAGNVFAALDWRIRQLGNPPRRTPSPRRQLPACTTCATTPGWVEVQVPVPGSKYPDVRPKRCPACRPDRERVEASP